MKINILPVNNIEKGIIYDSINQLFEYLKDDENVELVFIHITQFNRFDINLSKIKTCTDFVVNIVCKNKEIFGDFDAFLNIRDIQTFIDNTFAYLSVWQSNEIINDETFKKFFSRSFIIAEKNKSGKYLELWEKLQNDITIPQREVFYIDLFDLKKQENFESTNKYLIKKQ